MKIDPRALPADLQSLRELLLAEIEKRDERITQLEQENRLLRKEIFAPKSERRPSPSFAIDPSQMHLLFPELVEAAQAPQAFPSTPTGDSLDFRASN